MLVQHNICVISHCALNEIFKNRFTECTDNNFHLLASNIAKYFPHVCYPRSSTKALNKFQT